MPDVDDSIERPTVYGDAAHGTGEFLDHLAENDIDSRLKTQPPVASAGRFAKDRFHIDLAVTIRRTPNGNGKAFFAGACSDCPLRDECTNATDGRTIRVGVYEQRLVEARAQTQDPEWSTDYRAARPKVERKLGHLMRRRHGKRRARMRGKPKVDADFNLLAAAHNIARLGVLGLRSDPATGWAVPT